jgi:hypothetical protein
VPISPHRPSCRLPEPMFSAIVAKFLYEIALDLSRRGSGCHTPNGVGVSSASFVRGAPSDQRNRISTPSRFGTESMIDSISGVSGKVCGLPFLLRTAGSVTSPCRD